MLTMKLALRTHNCTKCPNLEKETKYLRETNINISKTKTDKKIL